MKLIHLPVWTCLFLIPLFGGCATERIVEKPVPVNVVRTERVPVPSDMLVRHQKTTVPDSLTYGEAIQLWSEDRRIIDTLLGQIEAIEALNDGIGSDDH